MTSVTCLRGYLPFSSAGKTPAEQRQSRFWLGQCTQQELCDNVLVNWFNLSCDQQVSFQLWTAFHEALWFTGAGCTSVWSYTSVSGFSNARCKHFKLSEVAAPHMPQIQASPQEISQKLTKSKTGGMYSFEFALVRQMKPSLIYGFSSQFYKWRIRGVLP